MSAEGHSSTDVAVHAFVNSLDAIIHHLGHNSAAFKDLSKGQAVAFAEFGFYGSLALQALKDGDPDKFGDCMTHISAAAVNGAAFGIPGLVTAIINTGISVKNELDGGHTLTPGQRFDRALHQVQDNLANAFFEFMHPDEADTIRVSGGDAPEPARRPIIVTPLPIDQATPDPEAKADPPAAARSGKPSMKFEPVIVTRDDAIAGPETEFEPVIVTRDDAIAGPDTEFEPVIVSRDDAIAGPDTEFEPVIITLDGGITGRAGPDPGPANERFYTAKEYSRITDQQSVEYHPELLNPKGDRPDTVFQPTIVTLDDAIAGPNTQFDIDVVDSSQYMTISPADGMHIDSRDRMVIPPSQGMHINSADQMDITPAESTDFIPEAMLSDTPGFSDTPDIGALDVPALDFTSLDLGAMSDPMGYLGGDLGPAGGLDYGVAWGAGEDFGVGYVGMGGGDLPAFDGGGWGGWGGDAGGGFGGDAGGGFAGDGGGSAA